MVSREIEHLLQGFTLNRNRMRHKGYLLLLLTKIPLVPRVNADGGEFY